MSLNSHWVLCTLPVQISTARLSKVGETLLEKGGRKGLLRQSVSGITYMKFEDLEINSLKNIYVYIPLWKSLWMPGTHVPHIKDTSRKRREKQEMECPCTWSSLGCSPLPKPFVHLFLLFLLTPTSSRQKRSWSRWKPITYKELF